MSFPPLVDVGNVLFVILTQDETGKLALLPETYTESHVAIPVIMAASEATPTMGFQLMQLHTGPWIIARRVAEENAELVRRATGIPDRLFTPDGIVERFPDGAPAGGASSPYGSEPVGATYGEENVGAIVPVGPVS